MAGEEGLEKVKNEVASCYQTAGLLLKSSSLEDMLKCEGSKSGGFGEKLELLGKYVKFGRLFPTKVRWKLGKNVLKEVETILNGGIEEMEESKKKGSVTKKIVKTLEFVLKCLEMIGNGGNGAKDKMESVESSCLKIFQNSVRCLASFELKKQEFMRILGACERIWRFLETLEGSGKCFEVKEAENVLRSNLENLFTSENGPVLIEFWCDNVPNSDIFTDFKLAQPQPEIYKVFLSYLRDNSFWMTTSGKAVTGHVILSILTDMTSPRPETRKLAAATLRFVTHQYANEVQIFDPEVPESSIVSLNNLENHDYIEFWTTFFQLYDALGETQVATVRPVLKKLQIFHDHSSNPSVLAWLPVILHQMIGHEDLSIVKAGFEEFMKTRYILEQEGSSKFILPYRKFSREFMKNSIMPLIKERIGWILQEGQDFFESIDSFGSLLVALYGKNTLAICQFILNLLIKPGKTMDPHSVYFVVSSLDQISTEFEAAEDPKTVQTLEQILLQMNHLLLSDEFNLEGYSERKVMRKIVSIMEKMKNLLIVNLERILPKFISLAGCVVFTRGTFLQELFKEKLFLINQLISEGLFEPNKTKEHNYWCGLFDILLQFVNEDNVFPAIEDFVDRMVNEEVLHESLGALEAFIFQCFPFPKHETCEITVKLMLNAYSELRTAKSTEELIRCLKAVYIVEDWPTCGISPNLTWEDGLKPESLVNLHILKKCLLKECSRSELSKDLLIMQEPPKDIDEDFLKQYFQVTGEYFQDDYRKVQFQVAVMCLAQFKDIQVETLVNVLKYVYKVMEKCDETGFALGLSIVRKIVNQIPEGDWELLDKIADVAWNLFLQSFKSEEPFWIVGNAFAELITCRHYIQNGYLEKYADLIFEHDKLKHRLPLRLLQELKLSSRENRPEEEMEKIHPILVKAALLKNGSPYKSRPKSAIWEYLCSRDDEDGCYYKHSKKNIPNCTARALACSLLEQDFCQLCRHCHLRHDEPPTNERLKLMVTSLLERDQQEMKAPQSYSKGSETPQMKQRLLQILLVLQRNFNLEISSLVAEAMLESLATESHQSSVRYMGEWLVILSILRYPQLHDKLFDSLDEYARKRIGYGASFSTMCIHLSKTLLSPKFVDRALESLATLTFAQDLTVKTYAQLAFQRIYNHAKSSTDSRLTFLVTSKYGVFMKVILDSSAYTPGDCSKLLETISTDFYLNIFDCAEHHHPEVIFIWLPKLSGMLKDELIQDRESLQKIFQRNFSTFKHTDVYEAYLKT